MSKDTTILKYVLQNSIKYNGKADLGSVIGKILSERPDFKKEIKKLQEDVKKVIKEVSKKKIEEQIQELKKIAPELLEKKEKEEKKIPELKNAVSGKLVTRFAPSPSGPLHIGHAYLLGLIHAYNRRYNGKLILRIEDTNLENIYPPAYDMIVEDANWLTNHGVWEVQIQSDNIDRYYYYAEKLIKIKKAYVCLCSPEEFKSFIEKKQACPHREQPIDVQLERWKKMFSEYAEGSAVLRIKTDINHKNPAMRDWAAMRIKDVEHGTHPRQGKKYRVWPLMNFAVAI
ncbi:MAG: glutamate--tRNA ligase family protein, partial [Candidatus Woesearchaeota archaeon]